jgi:hypothetical protein
VKDSIDAIVPLDSFSFARRLRRSLPAGLVYGMQCDENEGQHYRKPQQIPRYAKDDLPAPDILFVGSDIHAAILARRAAANFPAAAI